MIYFILLQLLSLIALFLSAEKGKQAAWILTRGFAFFFFENLHWADCLFINFMFWNVLLGNWRALPHWRKRYTKEGHWSAKFISLFLSFNFSKGQKSFIFFIFTIACLCHTGFYQKSQKSHWYQGDSQLNKGNRSLWQHGLEFPNISSL